jgi:signal transduction histidine kinase
VTLTTRLSLFLLVTLALVLAGFSLALYFLASFHLHGQAEERLEASLNTLVAAVDVGRYGLEWQPSERHLDVGPAALGDQVIWQLSDEHGHIVDRSSQPGAHAVLAEAAKAMDATQPSALRLDCQGERWLFSRRWIHPKVPKHSQTLPKQGGDDDDGDRYAALAVTAGLSLDPVYATLNKLLATLVGLSLSVWLIALFLGRAVCRRALRPVTVMAMTAQEMNVGDLSNRIPTASTGDELNDLGRAFNLLLDRLQESVERQQRFASDASHQLRTPLAVILGQIEVALRRPRPVEEYQRVLTTVQHKAGHLRRIVESLLFLARADSDARLGDLETVNLSACLADHLRTWSEHERAGDIVLEDAETRPSFVEVQPALLCELVNILIDNACKYSAQGTPITLQLHRDGEAAWLTVTDRGCGISATDLPHAFEPFFRAGEARQGGPAGIGLGLSIANRLARAFGGSLDATSQVGHGSCFRLRLPRARSTPQEPACELAKPLQAGYRR